MITKNTTKGYSYQLQLNKSKHSARLDEKTNNTAKKVFFNKFV